MSDKQRISSIPERVVNYIDQFESVVLIFGVSNTHKEDVERMEMVVSGRDKTMSNEIKDIFLDSIVVCVSYSADYSYLDEIDEDEYPDIIYLPLNFNHPIHLKGLRNLLRGKVTLMTFDWSVTKFVDWDTLTFRSFILKMLSPEGRLYVPISLNMVWQPFMESSSFNRDRIAEMGKSIYMWKREKITRDDIGEVNVYRMVCVDGRLCTGIMMNIQSMMHKDKIVVASEVDKVVDEDDIYMEGSITQRVLADTIHLDNDNSVKLDLKPRSVYYKRNTVLTDYDKDVPNKIFIMPSYETIVRNHVTFFSDQSTHEVQTTDNHVMMRDRWSRENMRWVVVGREV